MQYPEKFVGTTLNRPDSKICKQDFLLPNYKKQKFLVVNPNTALYDMTEGGFFCTVIIIVLVWLTFLSLYLTMVMTFQKSPNEETGLGEKGMSEVQS